MMPTQARRFVLSVRPAMLLVAVYLQIRLACADELQVNLTNADSITFVGAVRRWDADGSPRHLVNPKARIELPEADAKAEPGSEGRWMFRKLPAGRYDLVLLAKDRIRIEGFHYPPIAEFDPVWPSSAPPPPKDVGDWIRKDVANAKHYENKVTPLFMAGDRKHVRLFMQLLRDEPTSFDAEFGAPAATLRHEIWQYSNRAGGWIKERKTKVLDRTLLAKAELRRWTWVWVPELGGIEVSTRPVKFSYEIPAAFKAGVSAGILADPSAP